MASGTWSCFLKLGAHSSPCCSLPLSLLPLVWFPVHALHAGSLWSSRLALLIPVLLTKPQGPSRPLSPSLFSKPLQQKASQGNTSRRHLLFFTFSKFLRFLTLSYVLGCAWRLRHIDALTRRFLLHLDPFLALTLFADFQAPAARNSPAASSPCAGWRFLGRPARENER